MAEVFGNIGNERVELNNAATEATLRLLLQSSMAANKQNLDQLKRMVAKSGLQVDTANAGLEQVGQQAVQGAGVFKKLWVGSGLVVEQLRSWGSSLQPLGQELMAGTGRASVALDSLKGIFDKIHPVAGLVVGAFATVARIKEEELAQYRSISKIGGTFAGNLTEMRVTALRLGMTLSEQSAFIQKNSETLKTFGGSVEEGRKQVSSMALSIRNSDAGNTIRALGYSGQEAANAIASYVSGLSVGGKKTKEQQESLNKGAANYLIELDRLAAITGKSREELAEKNKVEKMSADAQLTLARMPPEQRAAFKSTLMFMQEKLGTAGVDMALAMAQNREVITEQGRATASLAPGVQEAMREMHRAGQEFGTDSEQFKKAQAKVSLAMQEGVDNISESTFSANQDLLGKVGPLVAGVAQDQIAGLTTAEAFAAREKKILEDREKRENSQAAKMANVEKAMQDLGATIYSTVSPALDKMVDALGKMAEAVQKVTALFNGLEGWQKGLVLGVGAIAAAVLAYRSVRGVANRLLGTIGELGKKGLPGAGGPQGGPPGSGGPPGKTPPKPKIEEKIDKRGKKYFVDTETGRRVSAQAAAAEKAAAEAAAKKAAEKAAAEAAAKTTAAGAVKAGAAKTAAKVLPGVGLAFGAYDAYQRVKGGDFLGAGIAGASGIASLIPGFGTAAALALDGTNLARDMAKANSDAKASDEKQESADETIIEEEEDNNVHEEKLLKEIAQLNTLMSEVARNTKETADFTKRNLEAIKSLNGNLFQTP